MVWTLWNFRLYRIDINLIIKLGKTFKEHSVSNACAFGLVYIINFMAVNGRRGTGPSDRISTSY